MRPRALVITLTVVLVSALLAVSCDSGPLPTAPDPSPVLTPSPTTAGVAPAAPTLLGPPNGANVTVPFTIRWSATIDSTALSGGYNWQISRSSSFSPLVTADATNPATREDVVSGLPNGTYFWRVNAADPVFENGVSAWSATRSFTVTGAGPGTPATPVLNPTRGFSTFHPHEFIQFSWSAVPNAPTYRLEVSNDSTFPMGPGTVTFWNENIRGTTDGYVHHTSLGQGTWYARVFATDADHVGGVRSLPSNIIKYTVFYNNPTGPGPVLEFPPEGATITLPFSFKWAHVPNPQAMGYEIQVSSSSSFSNNETPLGVQLTEPEFVVKTLSSGKKFWRVRSHQGMASPTTTATTAWSAVRSFTLSTAAPVPASITPQRVPLYSGDETGVELQLTAEVPAGGATIAVSSSNPSAVPVPATVSMPGSAAITGFSVQAGQVTAPTPVTLTATLNGASATHQLTLQPPSLKSLSMPNSMTGGVQAGGILMLNGQAPAGGAVVSLSSNSAAAQPPGTVTIPAGSPSTAVGFSTSPVSTNTLVTITATWKGGSVQGQMTLTPSPPPASITLDPTSVLGQSGSSFATVRIASPANSDVLFPITTSHPEITTVNTMVMIPAGVTAGGFNIFTSPVTTTTGVTISVSGGGVTRSAVLTVQASAPAPPPTPSAPSLVSPANGATAAQPIRFDWNNASNAASYEIQVDNSSSISAPFTRSQTVTVSEVTLSGLPAQRLWWRVRARNSAGVWGPFSSTRRVTAQAAPAAATLSSVSVSPTSVVGGNSSQGTATLSSAAPSGGAVVTLSSSNTGVAATPTNVTVPAGATSANFGITTPAVASSSTATISGSFGGVSRTTTLTVNPASTPPPAAALSAVSVSPSSVTGGNSSSGTVTLTSAAPSGGFLVNLSSSGSAASVPASVNVAGGSSTAGFNVTTTTVTSATGVTITASGSGVSRTTTLTVNPASSAPLPAPSLGSPSADQRFSPGQSITFNWGDVSGAASYTLQVDDNNSFPSPLVLTQTVTASQFTTSTLPTRTMWYRVRANTPSGSPGNWSSVRRFEVKN